MCWIRRPPQPDGSPGREQKLYPDWGGDPGRRPNVGREDVARSRKGTLFAGSGGYPVPHALAHCTCGSHACLFYFGIHYNAGGRGFFAR